jgi:hypothetical protein
MSSRVGLKGIHKSDGTLIIAVASTAAVYSKSFYMRYGQAFAIRYQLASSGTPNVKIELEQGILAPTTEGAADLAWVCPSQNSMINSNVNDKLVHIDPVTPCAMPMARIKITGINANPADTTITLDWGQAELIA